MALLAVLLAARPSLAQNKQRRLNIDSKHATARARGYIGGEAHDLYTIDVPAGKTMVVRVISKGHRADFYVNSTTEPLELRRKRASRLVGSIRHRGFRHGTHVPRLSV